MKKYKSLFLITIILLITFSFQKWNNTPIYFKIQKNWPKPTYDFTKNILTEEGFYLGKKLFYDPIMSRDSTISCASCHLQQTGFTHVDHELSHGIDGKIGNRNSLTLINLAWNKSFMWDGGINHLEVQPLAPITSPVEMDEKMDKLVKKLNNNLLYKELFYKAFGTNKITGQLTLKAISQYLVMLKSDNSKYDKVMRNEIQFSEQEQNGYKLFKKNCVSCHTEPLFTNNSFENNGLEIDSTLNDYGRFKITNKTKDKFKFKVPTLRNIQYSYPYMHDGRFKSLTEVIKHYNQGIYKFPNLSNKLKYPMKLSDKERVDLVAFLKTLSDNDFLYNPKYSYK